MTDRRIMVQEEPDTALLTTRKDAPRLRERPSTPLSPSAEVCVYSPVN